MKKLTNYFARYRDWYVLLESPGMTILIVIGFLVAWHLADKLGPIVSLDPVLAVYIGVTILLLLVIRINNEFLVAGRNNLLPRVTTMLLYLLGIVIFVSTSRPGIDMVFLVYFSLWLTILFAVETIILWSRRRAKREFRELFGIRNTIFYFFPRKDGGVVLRDIVTDKLIELALAVHNSLPSDPKWLVQDRKTQFWEALALARTTGITMPTRIRDYVDWARQRGLHVLY